MGHQAPDGVVTRHTKQPRRTTMSSAELAETFEANQLDYVKKLARKHTAEAIRVLYTLMTSKATKVGVVPPAAKIAAAKAILEYGYGRPGSQLQPARQQIAGGGVQVNIWKLGSEGDPVAAAVNITPQESAAEVLSANAPSVPAQPGPGSP